MYLGSGGAEVGGEEASFLVVCVLIWVLQKSSRVVMV